MHGFQGQVPVALVRQIQVCVLEGHRQKVQEVFQIQTVQPDRTGTLVPLQAVVQVEGPGKIFGVPFQLPQFRVSLP